MSPQMYISLFTFWWVVYKSDSESVAVKGWVRNGLIILQRPGKLFSCTSKIFEGANEEKELLKER